MIRCLFQILVFMLFWNGCYGRNKAVADSCLHKLHIDKTLSKEDQCNLLYQIILNNNDHDSCIWYANNLIEIAEKIHNPLYLHRGLYEKGQAYIFKSHFKKSISLLLRSLGVAQENGFEIESGLCYYVLSQVYCQTNNKDQAINYLKKSLSIFEKDTTQGSYLAGNYYQLGNIYFENDQPDSALFYYYKAAIFFEKHRNTLALAYTRGNIGAIQTKKLRQPDSARLNLLFAINILEKLGENSVNINYYLHLSENELNNGLPLKALEYVTKAYQLDLINPNAERRRDVYEQMSKVCAVMGDYAKAYYYQKEFYTLRDSLVNLDMVTQMANLRTDFEVGQKQAEVDLLEDMNKAKSRVVLFMVLGLVVFLVLLIVIFVGYRHKLVLSRKLQEQKKKLAARKVEMEEANNAKDRLFSVISHDLRGPVGSLKNLATLIVQSLDARELKDAGELAFSMSESSQQVEFLLDNLLHWSISRQNLYKPKKDAFELNRLVNEVMNVYVQTARAKQIQLTYNPSYSSITIESDSNCWATIIRNLVNNAIKFTPIGGKVDVYSSYINGFVRIEVTDNGLGMNSDQIDNLFNFVGKVSEWGTKNEKGQGLGLCLVNDFVKMQDGSIEVKSEYGKGSKFIVTIPAHLVQKGERIAQMQLF